METTAGAFSITTIKNVSYIATFLATAEYLGFSHQATIAFTTLMVVDVITGMTRAAIVEGTGSLRSAVWTRGILAKILLMTALFSSALAGKTIGIEAAVVANGMMNVLMLSELYSILGNIHSIRTRKPKAEFDAVAWMLAKIKELLASTIK